MIIRASNFYNINVSLQQVQSFMKHLNITVK